MKKVMRHKDTDGREYLEVAGDEGVTLVTIGGETDNELSDYYQDRSDKDLDRWRDPKSPGWVVHLLSVDEVRVVCEQSGSAMVWHRSEVVSSVPHSVSATVAQRYFSGHPKTKPWYKARPGEVWVLTSKTVGELAWIASFQVEEKVCFRQVKNLLEPIPADDPDIVAGRRIWPE